MANSYYKHALLLLCFCDRNDKEYQVRLESKT